MATRLSRRVILGGSVLTLGFAGGSSMVGAVHDQAELFVFRSADCRSLVLAVAVPVVAASRAGFDVVIHTGRRNWRVGDVRPLEASAISERGDGRIFTGEVDLRGTRYTAVVLERPSTGERLGVWAEVISENGARFRLGSPFTASLLARDPALSRAYHATSPEADRALFTDALSSRIGMLAAAGGIVSSDTYARRLVGRLLPDVINYCPDLPVGFNFASQNGRHPADDAEAVVETVLSGVARPRTFSRPVEMTEVFPYLPRPVAAT